MDTAVAAIKLGAVWVATVMMVISVMMAYTGGLEARSAARSAARAAAAALAGSGWNCVATTGDPAWDNAAAAAAAASGDRLRGNERLRVVGFSASADTATCTVLTSLEVLPVTIGWWAGTFHAVGCAPTRAGVGLGVLTVCGQGP